MAAVASKRILRIGYQGETGSNSEEAAKKYAESHCLTESHYTLIPLLQAHYVGTELKEGHIDCGVFATQNSMAGTVSEAYNAIKDEYFELVGTI